jgi:RNA polymerase sigma-70 factor (ECF subfamily)
MEERVPPLDVAQLVVGHHEAIYRYAYRMTGSVPDAEDLTQQVFLTAQQKIGQLRDAQRVRGWLYSVLRRCFLKSCRKQRPTPATSLELEVEHIPDSLEQGFGGSEEIDREELQLAIDELPSEHRLVLLLFYFEFCSYKEISERLEIPLGTVMSRLSRAKSAIRQRLLSTAEQVEEISGREGSL